MKKGPFDFHRLKSLLDQEYQWPCDYMFKFIVPINEFPKLQLLFPIEQLSKKPSKKGNYLAVTVCARRESSEDVIKTYLQAKVINGIISL